MRRLVFIIRRWRTSYEYSTRRMLLRYCAVLVLQLDLFEQPQLISSSLPYGANYYAYTYIYTTITTHIMRIYEYMAW